MELYTWHLKVLFVVFVLITAAGYPSLQEHPVTRYALWTDDLQWDSSVWGFTGPWDVHGVSKDASGQTA